MRRPVTKLRAQTAAKASATAYLHCEVEGGMFNQEKIVSVTLGDVDISVIVNDTAINHGRLQVHVYGKKGKSYLIGLPGESFSSPRIMWVDQAQLQLQ